MQIDAVQSVLIVFERPQAKQKKAIDLSKYTGRGEKLFTTDAQIFVRELRDGDRVYEGCDLFLTNDGQLKQYKELHCLLVDEIDT